MSVLLLKIFLAPSIIAGLSLYARRYGHMAAGFLTGLPLTSGPVALVLAFQNGTEFVAGFSIGILSGITYVALFNLVYAWSCRKFNWGICILLAVVAYAIPAIFIKPAWAGPVFSFAFSLLFIFILGFLFPKNKPAELKGKVPAWDIPVRALLATIMVFTVSALADRTGPAYSGIISSFPVFVAVFTASTHHHHGKGEAVRLLKGILLSSYAFITFFTVLGTTIVSLGIAASFALAILSAFLVQLLLHKISKLDQA